MVSPLCFWLFVQAASGNASPSKQEQMLEWLNGNPTIGWGIASFAVVAMAVATTAKLTGNLDNIISFFDKYRPKKQEITDEERQKLRRQLIDVVLRQVVKRLEDSLHHKIRMGLRYQEERQRIGQRDLPPVENSRPLDQFIRRAISPFGSAASSVPVKTDVSTAALLKRDDIKGRLLILGEPGAGKTNELLAVAKELLQQAQHSDEAPIPVIFELSEWSSEQGKTFADWLIEQLQQKYTVQPGVSKQWIEQNQLLPLLDGLDELRRVDSAKNASSEEADRKRQAKQIQCMRTINTFLDLHSATSMVVCCRRKEYEALEAQGEYLKRLNGSIYLQELNDKQIKSYLNDSNRGALWESLQHQPALLDLARSPLFLLMLVVAYQGQPIQTIDELLDLYIEKQLSDLNNQGAYPPGKSLDVKKTRHYLSWLAVNLEKRGITEFLIERLQPSWIEQEFSKKRYRLILGLSIGLIYGLSTGLISMLSGELIFGLSAGLIFGSIHGLSAWRIIGLLEIKLTEELRFSWTAVWKERGWLIFSLFFGLIGGLIAGLVNWLISGLIVGLIVGSIAGLIFGLYVGLVGGLSDVLIGYESEIYEKQLPNQGIKRSIKTSINVELISGMIFGLIGVLIGALLGKVISWLIFGLFLGLILGLFIGLWFELTSGLYGSSYFGLLTALQHLSLRFVLYKSGVAPWNYAKFLEHAENHRFIQRVGGRYRFVHDLLRKRFAERYQPKWR